MCNVCCKEFRGWCKSFTKIETALAILEAVLLVVFIALVVFLILHFLACFKGDKENIIAYATPKLETKYPTQYSKPTEIYFKPTGQHHKPSGKYYTPTEQPTKSSIKCSWTPSAKTTAKTHYYEDAVLKPQATNHHSTKVKSTSTTESDDDHLISNNTLKTESSIPVPQRDIDVDINTEYIEEDFTQLDQTDGEEPEDIYKRYAVALVILKPPRDVIFGCVLTLINSHWTLTAASCIESIEEVDSLVSLVMMKDYGTLRKGKIHSVSDIQIHPLYVRANKSYDLAALKSEDSLQAGGGYAVNLPSVVDYFLVTIGERFVMLGYGAFRTIDKGPSGRKLRTVYVYTLPSRQCSTEDTWSLRHLSGGSPVALCAGVLFARGAPCNYCAGAPLFSGATLLGVMADNRRCGVACEPQIFVNIALVKDWIDSVTTS